MLLKYGTFFCLFVVLLLWLDLNVSCDNISNNSYFPPDVKICSAKDPNLDECFVNSANNMLKHLAHGIRHLDAVPMDPLHVPLLALERNNSIFPSLAFNVTNTVHRGWKDVVMVRSKVNLKAHEFFFVLYVPLYFVRGRYEITGSIIGIPVEGSGDFGVRYGSDNAWRRVRIFSSESEERSKTKLPLKVKESSAIKALSDATVTPYLNKDMREKLLWGPSLNPALIDNSTLSVTVRGRLEDRNGEEYFLIDDAFQHSYFGKIEVDFKNLFNNSALSAITNRIVNYNYRAVLDAITPALDKTYSVLYSALVQRIFDRVPYRAMFTDLD